MKIQKHFLLLLMLCTWRGASTTQAATANAVGSWGSYTTVPIAAQSGVTAIAAGGGHTVALKSNGSVVAWGSNGYGQTDVPVAAQSGVRAIAAGEFRSVALKNDGSVVAWGNNCCGQTDVPIAAQSGVTAIAAGRGHTVVLKTDGSVVAWGSNLYGQTNVPVAAQSGVTAIAAGWDHTVALKSDGSVLLWGYNQGGGGQATVPVAAQSGVAAIAAGGFHTVALKNDGSVLAWEDYGQTDVPIAAQSGVMAIAAGGGHTVALKNDGSVVAWGDNSSGQTTVPPGLSGVSAIAAGGLHTVVIVIPTFPTITTQPVSQTVSVWQSPSFTVTATGFPLYYQWRKDGMNLPGATSDTYNLPLTQTNQAGRYSVVINNILGSVISDPLAVLRVNATAAPGTAVAWGYNSVGETRVPLVAQSGVTAIAAGGGWSGGIPRGHTVALKNDGTVVAWGFGEATISDNPNSAPANPVTLRGQVLSGVTAIVAGGFHAVALKDDGSVVTWGDNFYGQTTVPVAAQSGVTAIAAGGFHTAALKKDGSVVAWGRNFEGQTTVPVAAQSGVTAIAAGGFCGIGFGAGFCVGHTVALKNDGSVVAWGDNRFGQTTVPLAAQSRVTAIAAGFGHTVALKNDGSVVAWGGNNAAGEVVDFGQTTVPVAAQSGVTAIAAGGYHTVALKNDGSVVAWGRDSFGQTTVPAGLSGVTAIAAGNQHTVALLGPVLLLPSLKAQRSGNELILSWPTNALSFKLQSTFNLTPPVTWIDFASVPAAIGAQFTVTKTITGGAQFYLLTKP